MLTSSKLIPFNSQISAKSLKNVFFCPEESDFYSYCLETLVLNNSSNSESIVELGSGDGSPVIKALLRTSFDGIIHGFEINRLAYKAATSKIEEYELSHKYTIHNYSFFDYSRPPSKYLISNPPYLPALDNNLYQPLLYGGIDGITVTKQLLNLGYENVLVMVSSYSNPVGLIDYATAKGYCVSNFLVSPLTFGYYSSDPKVRSRIAELKENSMAFYSRNIYLLAGVLFTNRHKCQMDLGTEFIQIITSL